MFGAVFMKVPLKNGRFFVFVSNRGDVVSLWPPALVTKGAPNIISHIVKIYLIIDS